jgi:membrane protein implicated in regulation of membrane protease activity
MSKQCLVGIGIAGLLWLTAQVAGWFAVILLAICFIVLAMRLARHFYDRENAYWDRVFQRHREEQELKQKSLQKRKAVAPSARRSLQDSCPPESVHKWN